MAYLSNVLNTQLTGIAVPDGSVGNDLLRINDVDPMFTMLNDGSALFYRLLTMYGSEEAASQPQYHFFNDDIYASETNINNGAGYSASDTSIVVDDAIGVANAHAAIRRTGEIIRITSASTTTWTVVRGVEGSTAAAILDNDEVVLLGGVLPERGAANGGIVQLPTKVQNYVSFFSQSVSSSSLQEATEMLNGVGQMQGEFQKMTLWLMRQMDKALRYSKKDVNTDFAGSGKAAYFTAGLEEYVTTNTELTVDGLTWYDFNTAFNAAFLPTNSSPTKTLICSQTAFSAINKVAYDRWTANPAFEATLGATMGQIVLDGGGVIDVVLDKYGFGTQGKQGYLLDLPYVKTKEMANHGLQWRDITLPTDHGSKSEVYGSTSLKLQLPSLHRTITLA